MRKFLADNIFNSLAENTLWALFGYGLRLIIQAAYFIIMARRLGPGQYGAFVAATALANLISPFVGLGAGNLLIKNVARNKELFGEYWGNGLFVTLVSGLALVGFGILSASALLPHTIPIGAIFCISISDLVFVKFLDLAAFAFQSFDRLSANAHLNVLISLVRLMGIVVLAAMVPQPTVQSWSIVYLAGSVLAAVIATVWATAKLGRPSLALARVPKECFQGIAFSTGLSAQTVYNDIDKTMLARLGALEATGIYSAAYRLIEVAFIPVRALLNAALPSFFRSGLGGIRGTLRYSRRLLTRILPYPVLAFAAMMVGAPLVPFILGPQYANVTDALRWLSLLPLLKTLHYFAADALTGAGYQTTRTVVQIGVAVFNILFNLWIIPAYGWRGAAISSLASDGLLAVMLWAIAIRLWSTSGDRDQESRSVTGARTEPELNSVNRILPDLP